MCWWLSLRGIHTGPVRSGASCPSTFAAQTTLECCARDDLRLQADDPKGQRLIFVAGASFYPGLIANLGPGTGGGLALDLHLGSGTRLHNTQVVMTDRTLRDPGADMVLQRRGSTRTHGAGSGRWPLLHLRTRNSGSG